MPCPKCGSDNCLIKITKESNSCCIKCYNCTYEYDEKYTLGTREAFCSKCKFTTYHKEIGADSARIYLECMKCGTKRTWLRAGHALGK